MPVYHGAEIYQALGLRSVALIGDLATTTLAALAPGDFEVKICDEHIAPVDFNVKADYIGITGKSTQAERMLEIGDQFRQRGYTVLMGGPYASLDPETCRPHCDILAQGEMEEVAEELFADLRHGQWKAEYFGSRPDLRLSPIPRWDLYPNHLTIMGCVQTSRGCPFDCEFCDVIQYVGRKQRHKSVDQIIRELDVLYAAGYRRVFLADDNFTVYRRRTRELLNALIDWNKSNREPVAFTTQVSIDIARDKDILQLSAQAGLTEMFIGIETPNEESLKETRKRQNVGIDLAAEVQRFLDEGIHVIGGMVVGFDSDGPDIFQQQYEFAMSTPVPIFTLGALTAPKTTPLYDRLEKDGRLNGEDYTCDVNPWGTNIVPAQMSREEFFDGMKWLANSLYRAESFSARLEKFIDALATPAIYAGVRAPDSVRDIDKKSITVIGSVAKLGAEESKMFYRVMSAAMNNPYASLHVMSNLFRYAQIRHLYDQGRFWEPQLVEAPVHVAGAMTSGRQSQPGNGGMA